ncbi:MAG: MFS transporter, partial [Sciscionella sp.]
TLFFSAATAESKTKVALYLLITVAPFGLIAPVIGPLLDRIQHGRRLALALSCLGQAVLAVVLAMNFTSWVLYPAALGMMVLSKSFTVLKAAVTPRVLPPGITLVKTNARLTVFGLAAGGTFGALAAGVTKVSDSAGALWFTMAICAVDALLCLRIPHWVEETTGEVPTSLTTQIPIVRRVRRQPMGRHVVVALWGNGTIRMLTGFLMLFAAFVIKSHTQHHGFEQVLLLGAIGAAAGLGSFAGNAVGARLHMGSPDQVVLGCVASAVVVTTLAAVLAGVATAALVGLIGATASALAKVSLDATIQSDLPPRSRASAFGRSETILQLAWVLGGAIGLLLPATFWIGFTVIACLLALGGLQSYLSWRGSSLVPRFGGDRPARPEATDTFAVPRTSGLPYQGGTGGARFRAPSPNRARRYEENTRRGAGGTKPLPREKIKP